MNKKVITILLISFITSSCYAFYKKPSHALVKKTFKSVPPHARCTVLSRDPFICRVDNFLSDEETEHLKQIAAAKLERSRVGVDASGIDDCRTSSSAMFDNQHDAIVQSVVKRGTDMIGFLFGHAEGLQVVHYDTSQEFKPHLDAFEDDEVIKLGNKQRVGTFFIYLNDLASGNGGETEFTQLGLKVTPKKNSAVFWYNTDRDGNNKDPRMLHAGLPPKAGEKWGVNLWILNRPY